MSKKKRFSKSQISVIRMTGITKIVTWQNFREFFGADGRLLETVDDSALLFQGKFDGNELNIHRITIDRPVSFIGDFKVLEAVFKDIAIDIVSSNVTIDRLVLKASVPLGDLISVRRSGVSINNMRIEYRCGDESSNVINISGGQPGGEESARGKKYGRADQSAGADPISDVIIRNNRILFASHVPDDTHHASAINLDNAKDITIDGNRIKVSIPALVAKNFSRKYFMMGLNSINALRICEAESVKVTDNAFRVMVNGSGKKYISSHVIYIAGSDTVRIEKNSVTLKDTHTPEGSVIAICGIQCGYSRGVRFLENRFDLSTRGGKSTVGSMQGINHTDCSGTEIKGNTFYCNSRGPVSALFLTSMKGLVSEISVVGNSIEVSGYAKDESPYALVSGVEVQNSTASITANTILVSNKNKEDNSGFPVVGVGYVQRLAGQVSFSVKGNTIRTNGEYTVYTVSDNVREVTVTGNSLTSAKRTGNDSVKVKAAEVTVADNTKPRKSDIIRRRGSR